MGAKNGYAKIGMEVKEKEREGEKYFNLSKPVHPRLKK